MHRCGDSKGWRGVKQDSDATANHESAGEDKLRCDDTHHQSTFAKAICVVEGVSLIGNLPVAAAKGGGIGLPSASARSILRYQSAALVSYFSAMGRSAGTPCSFMKSLNRLFPPFSIIFSCTGFQESIVVDRTKLIWTLPGDRR